MSENTTPKPSAPKAAKVSSVAKTAGDATENLVEAVGNATVKAAEDSTNEVKSIGKRIVRSFKRNQVAYLALGVAASAAVVAFKALANVTPTSVVVVEETEIVETPDSNGSTQV